MAFSGSGPGSYNLRNSGGLSGGSSSGTDPAGGLSGAGSSQTPIASDHSANGVGGSGGAVSGSDSGSVSAVASAFQVEHQNVSVAVMPPVTPGESAKKKRGRPRKYALGTNVPLGLSPLSATGSSGTVASSDSKRLRGRPPGTGWRQRLAIFGEWMTSPAGLGCKPHVILVGATEDVAAKILSVAQLRSSSLCIVSATGSVSAVTLTQDIGSATYEGSFEILSLSGSYLIDEGGGGIDHTGGISISVSNPEGQVIGGAVRGRVIAEREVEVVAFSFLSGDQANNGSETIQKGENNSGEACSSTPVNNCNG